MTIQGLYVSTFETEYSKGMDTIEITPLNSEAGTFFYVRRVGYRRILNHAFSPLKHEMENSICVFNPNSAQLSEQRHGRIYSFSSDGEELVSGSSVYKRIRQK